MLSLPSLNCWPPPGLARPSGPRPAHPAQYRTPPHLLPVRPPLNLDPQPTLLLPEPASQPERRVLPGIAAQYSTHLRADGLPQKNPEKEGLASTACAGRGRRYAIRATIQPCLAH